jgi:hypothetical protein
MKIPPKKTDKAKAHDKGDKAKVKTKSKEPEKKVAKHKKLAPPPPERVDVPPAAVLAARNHWRNHLGQPSRVMELKGNPTPGSAIQRLEIAVYAPGGGGSTTLFATCGMSQHAMQDGRRMEVVLMARPEPDKDRAAAIHTALGVLAVYAEHNKVSLGPGSVIFSPEEIKRFSKMDALVLLPPLPFVEPLATYQWVNQQRVDVLWVVPLHDAEAKLCLDKGAGNLLKLFDQAKADLANLERKALV